MSDTTPHRTGEEREDIEEFRAAMAAVREGDFTQRVDPAGKRGELAELAREYNAMMDDIESRLSDVWSFTAQVTDASGAVNGNSLEIEAVSEQVSSQVGDISERTDEQSSRLGEVASEIEQLSATIEEMSASATEVSETAAEATERSQRGREAAQRAIEEIHRVEEASDGIVDLIEGLEAQMERVDEAIDVIADVADQTTMLALNANIEAARAGEEGEGFAVVADEVKQLARETQESAAEIEDVIRESQSRTDETVAEIRSVSDAISGSVATVEDAFGALEDIVDQTQAVDDAIREISEAIDDQADRNARIAAEIEDVADLSDDVDDQAGRAAAAARGQTELTATISSQAAQLREQVQSLESSLSDFAASEWGERINEHCRSAGIDWRQQAGTTITVGLAEHPFTDTAERFLGYFEGLTGIDVEYEVSPEEELFDQLERDLEAGSGRYDVFFLGLWPAARYHANGWVQDLHRYLEDASLTDRRWYGFGDYPDSVVDALSYGQNDELVGIPFGVEAYGCVAYDRPTFRKLGLEEPTTYEELLHAAKTIHESEAVDRGGACSRTSADFASTANWAAMFKSYGAHWIDYRRREATLDSPAGVASLEDYADLVGTYGPPGGADLNWLAAHETYGRGETGIILHTPAAVGIWENEQYERTKWLPPLEGPEGERVANTWAWSLGINAFSEQDEAAWLFLQWATCREMNLLLSTRQWADHGVYGHARGGWIFDQPEYERRGHVPSWVQAHDEGIDLVPTDPPPVPLDTAQNVDIMSAAAGAMHATVAGERSAERALSDAAGEITDYAKQI
jgi:multiple sugar transport system substrate-binding protein